LKQKYGIYFRNHRIVFVNFGKFSLKTRFGLLVDYESDRDGYRIRDIERHDIVPLT